MWEGAVDVLVGNSVSLMHSIEELIKDAQVAAVVSRARTKDGECRSIGRRVHDVHREVQGLRERRRVYKACLHTMVHV